jgi:hypothetical protein
MLQLAHTIPHGGTDDHRPVRIGLADDTQRGLAGFVPRFMCEPRGGLVGNLKQNRVLLIEPFGPFLLAKNGAESAGMLTDR